jgi:hypothetical protein
VLSADYFNVPTEQIKDIESVLTMVGGKVVYGVGPFSSLAPPLPPVQQDWLPVREYGEYYKRSLAEAKTLARAMSQPGLIADGRAWEACGCGVF